MQSASLVQPSPTSPLPPWAHMPPTHWSPDSHSPEMTQGCPSVVVPPGSHVPPLHARPGRQGVSSPHESPTPPPIMPPLPPAPDVPAAPAMPADPLVPAAPAWLPPTPPSTGFSTSKGLSLLSLPQAAIEPPRARLPKHKRR